MTFTDAHTSSSVCTPSRYSLLTGRWCRRKRLKNPVLWNYEGCLMDPNRLNMASLLMQRGYYTAIVGKWHLGLDWTGKNGEETSEEEQIDFTQPFANGPCPMRFDYFFGLNA